MNSDSILDKVITSKQQSDMMEFNPQEIVSLLLKRLTNKEEDVLRRRFGLSDQPKETLEAIGKIYNVTRERIRQVENSAIKKIKKLKEFVEIRKNLENILSSIIKQNGGIVDEDSLFAKLLSYSSDTSLNRHCIVFILAELLPNRFQGIDASGKFKKSWRLTESNLDFIEKAISELVAVVKEFGSPLSLDELVEEFKKSEFYKNNSEKLPDQVISSYVEVSQQIGKNPFEEYGLKEWGAIHPKRMNDKIYIVLKKESQPLHFNKITELINKVHFDRRKAYPPTVHNELILNDRYVLVGRGIYALKEWGYKPGVVADVLASILKKSGNPMTREELVASVLKQRVVKKNTIHLALTDKSKFRKLPDGRYALVDQPSQGE